MLHSYSLLTLAERFPLNYFYIHYFGFLFCSVLFCVFHTHALQTIVGMAMVVH